MARQVGCETSQIVDDRDGDRARRGRHEAGADDEAADVPSGVGVERALSPHATSGSA